MSRIRAYDVHAGEPSRPGAYWRKTGRYQDLYDDLWALLVPAWGECPKAYAEPLRASSQLYYDGYNNGFGNIPDSACHREEVARVAAWARGMADRLPHACHEYVTDLTYLVDGEGEDMYEVYIEGEDNAAMDLLTDAIVLDCRAALLTDVDESVA